MCVCMYIYIYIYIHDTCVYSLSLSLALSPPMCMCVYIYKHDIFYTHHAQVKLQISAYPDVAFMALKCRQEGSRTQGLRVCLPLKPVPVSGMALTALLLAAAFGASRSFRLDADSNFEGLRASHQLWHGTVWLAPGAADGIQI